MNPLDRLYHYLRITGSGAIMRRYFVVNGFDGALTMLGIVMGFYVSGAERLEVILGTCLGAAIALCMSGLSSAYISETAERKRELRELESAMVADLHTSDYGRAARFIPLWIALVNGLSPLLISLLIMLPLWLTVVTGSFPYDPLIASIATTLAIIFLLGVFLGRISASFWLWAGLRALLLGLVTCGIILLVGAV